MFPKAFAHFASGLWSARGLGKRTHHGFTLALAEGEPHLSLFSPGLSPNSGPTVFLKLHTYIFVYGYFHTKTSKLIYCHICI